MAVQEDLRHSERDELGIGDLWATPCTGTPGQEIVHQHVKCGEQAVKVGGHEATSVVELRLQRRPSTASQSPLAAHPHPATIRNQSSRGTVTAELTSGAQRLSSFAITLVPKGRC